MTVKEIYEKLKAVVSKHNGNYKKYQPEIDNLMLGRYISDWSGEEVEWFCQLLGPEYPNGDWWKE